MLIMLRQINFCITFGNLRAGGLAAFLSASIKYPNYLSGKLTLESPAFGEFGRKASITSGKY
jgi:hypothetical protein